MLHDHRLIAGDCAGSDNRFTNMPVSGAADSFAIGSPDLVNRAVAAANLAGLLVPRRAHRTSGPEESQ